MHRTSPRPAAPLYKPVPTPDCDLEIRRTTDQNRVARVPHAECLGADRFTGRARRRIGQLPDGKYLLAFCVEDKRYSNVAQLTLDSDFDPSTYPTLSLIPLEMEPGQKLPLLGIRAIGPTPQDQDLTNMSIAFPRIFVDGIEHKGKGPISIMMVVAPLEPGKVYTRILSLDGYEPAIKPGQKHTAKAIVGRYESAPVVIPADDILSQQWDKSTEKLPPIPPPKVVLQGEVIGLDGNAGINFEVHLFGKKGERFSESSDDDGKYSFLNIPAGEYKLVCNPKSKGRPGLTIEQVLVDANESLVLNLSLERKYNFAGKIYYEDGKPSAGMDVALTCENQQTNALFDDYTTTDTKGSYELGGPFGHVSYIGINGGRINGEMPELKPGITKLNYVLKKNKRGNTIGFPAEQPPETPDVQVEGGEVWGEVVDGLRVGMSMKKTSFALDEPIQVQWQIKNVSQEDKTIIWHKLHYSPVVFEIGQSGEKKYIREDSRRMFNGAKSGPPEKIILKPSEIKKTTFDLRRFGLDSSVERGIYEVTGMYSPKDSRQLAYWLKRPEFKGCFTGQISSAQLKITITENLLWLQNQLRKGKFWDRLQAARRLAPIIGNKEVLAELEKMYPPGNTRQMVWLVDHMAEFSDTSHVTEVLDMYEVGGYTPFWGDYGDDMLVFLLKWGQDRGVSQLSEYLKQHKETTEGTAEHHIKRDLLKALMGGSYWYFDFEIGENALPLLILTLDEKTIEGSLTLKSGTEVKVRWCDSAALSIQKMLKHDWGFKLNLSEKERDEIVSQMQAELAGRVPVLPKVEPKVRFKTIDFPHGSGSSQGLMLAVNPAKASFRIDEDIVLGFYMHNSRGAIKLYCIYQDDLWQWTSLMIQDSHGKLLEMPIHKPAETMRPISKDDFFAIPPGKTIYWEQTFKKAWLPKGGLKPGSYKFFISINKAKTMSSCINGYDEFCSRYYLTDYKGTPEAGPVSVKIVSGKDPADETLSERLERSFYFRASQEKYKGRQRISFYIHYGGVESLPKISVEDLMISRHIKSLNIAGIQVELSDFDEDLMMSEGRSRQSLYLPEDIKGLDTLKPGKYPVRLVLEGDIYKANQSDQPLEHWQVELQEEIELNSLILRSTKGISTNPKMTPAVQVEGEEARENAEEVMTRPKIRSSLNLDVTVKLLVGAVGENWQKIKLGNTGPGLKAKFDVLSTTRPDGSSLVIKGEYIVLTFPFDSSGQSILAPYTWPPDGTNGARYRVLGTNEKYTVLTNVWPGGRADQKVSQAICKVLQLYPPEVTGRSLGMANRLKRKIDTFRLALRAPASGRKRGPSISLRVPQEKDIGGWTWSPPAVQISQEQANKIIDYLTTDGYFDRSVNVMQVAVPISTDHDHFTIWAIDDDRKNWPKNAFVEELNWNLDTLHSLDELRKILKENAAEAMDKFMENFSAQRQQWKKKVKNPLQVEKEEGKTILGPVNNRSVGFPMQPYFDLDSDRYINTDGKQALGLEELKDRGVDLYIKVSGRILRTAVDITIVLIWCA